MIERITYIAETNLKAMLKDKDYVNKRIIENATIVEKGLLTNRFSYLKSFAQIEEQN